MIEARLSRRSLGTFRRSRWSNVCACLAANDASARPSSDEPSWRQPETSNDSKTTNDSTAANARKPSSSSRSAPETRRLATRGHDAAIHRTVSRRSCAHSPKSSVRSSCRMVTSAISPSTSYLSRGRTGPAAKHAPVTAVDANRKSARRRQPSRHADAARSVSFGQPHLRGDRIGSRRRSMLDLPDGNLEEGRPPPEPHAWRHSSSTQQAATHAAPSSSKETQPETTRDRRTDGRNGSWKHDGKPGSSCAKSVASRCSSVCNRARTTPQKPRVVAPAHRLRFSASNRSGGAPSRRSSVAAWASTSNPASSGCASSVSDGGGGHVHGGPSKRRPYLRGGRFSRAASRHRLVSSS